MYLIDKLPALSPEGEVDEVGKKLLEAAETIRVGGLAKNSLAKTDGSHCLVGAILVHVKLGDGFGPCLRRVTDHLGLHSMIDLPTWNNAPERTAEQVISALTRAARAKG